MILEIITLQMLVSIRQMEMEHIFIEQKIY